MSEESKVVHNAQSERFEMMLDDGTIAYLSYKLKGNTASFEHTSVPDQFQGKGLAAKLTKAALSEARAKGWKVIPVCRYVDVFIRRNSGYSDLLA